MLWASASVKRTNVPFVRCAVSLALLHTHTEQRTPSNEVIIPVPIKY